MLIFGIVILGRQNMRFQLPHLMHGLGANFLPKSNTRCLWKWAAGGWS